MFAPILGLALLAGPSTPPAIPASAVESSIAAWMGSAERPRVSIWTDRESDAYQRGDRARVYVEPQEDGYITVMRVDTDGRIRMVFPRDPWEDNFARGGRTFEVLDRDNRAFSIDDYPGVGYVFAITSPDPFRYDDFVRGDHWDYRLIADGRVRGDPYEALTDFASRIVGPGEYDYDIVPYYVEKHYDYPRFLCYDCHTYASYPYWDPYRYSCSKFRIVIYDDYYYYPYRYWGPRRVVVNRPARLRPRYIFRDYERKNTPYISRVKNRPADDRITERDRSRTSRDLGGRGSVPLPTDVRRRVGENPGAAAGGNRRTAPDNRAAPDRRAAPGQAEPRRAEPQRAEPRSAEPRRAEPQRAEPQSAEPRRAEPQRAEPQSAEPRRAEPQRADPSQAEPRRAEPQRAEPRRAEPQRAEPRRAEPQRAEPRRAEPQRAEPRRAEPQRAEPRRAEPSSGRATGDPQLRRRKP